MAQSYLSRCSMERSSLWCFDSILPPACGRFGGIRLRTDRQAHCTLAPILHLLWRLGEHVVALEPRYGWPSRSVNACAPAHLLTRNGLPGLCSSATVTIRGQTPWASLALPASVLCLCLCFETQDPTTPVRRRCCRSTPDAVWRPASLAIGLFQQDNLSTPAA
jgi:hypothetical protein